MIPGLLLYMGIMTDTMTVREAGRLGGLETLRRRGRDHFVRAGHRGQKVMALRYGPEDRKRWGRMGGRPRKVRIVITGEVGNSKGRRQGEPPGETFPPPDNDCRQIQYLTSDTISGGIEGVDQ